MKPKSLILLLLAVILLLAPASALAQNLSFSLSQEIVHAFWNEDGTLSLDYLFVFNNDPGASPIDFVDVGLPNDNYDRNTVFADVDGRPINDIEESPYVDYGVALGLGGNAIPPGQTGSVHVVVGTIRDVLYTDSDNEDYASAVFAPTFFDSQVVHGNTDLTVVFHLPPGVQPEEPRWHGSPSGFPAEPETGFDDQGRITYSWRNPSANGYTEYTFGASFPKTYVPADAIVRPDPFAWLRNINFEALIPLLCFGFFGLIFILGLIGNSRRKMQYLPPKISIEGHGIKRGLTAVEAAILMEQPMDKILTMVLFATIKKNAARVISREPLDIERIEPIPEGLRPYEQDFLAAMSQKRGPAQKKALQKMMVDLIRSVGKKMEGFSRRETEAYYRDIMDRAWAQIEAAETPEVKSELFDEVMEWTMLDREFDDRTRDVFRTGPVFVPVWWPRYDPGYGRAPGPTTAPTTAPVPSTSGRPSLPHLPGSDFAASVVGGVQNFSTSVIGSVSEFTSNITNVTNPPPKPSSTGTGRSGGGGSCACACACAGCACACAGGGR
ncbi:MAG TPA: hypothetical protein VFZ76_10845 [Anaerolineales bacterium]